MNTIREDRVYTLKEMTDALLSAGQFASISKDEFEDQLLRLYSGASLNEHAGFAAQQTLLTVYRSKRSAERLFDPTYAIACIWHELGGMCMVCGAKTHSYSIFDLSPFYARKLCPDFLVLADKHGRHSSENFRFGDCLCYECQKLVRRRMKYTPPSSTSNFSASELMWMEILANVKRVPGTVKRMQKNAWVWEKCRFDPRRGRNDQIPRAVSH